MTTWQVFKTILKEVGFYRKKLIVFMLILAVGLSFNYFWQKSKGVEASPVFSGGDKTFAQSASIDVVVTKSGQVVIDGKKENAALKFYDNYDELKIVVFSSPGYYIQSFTGTVHLPEGVEVDKIRQMIYAVHGVGSYNFQVADSQTLTYTATDISPQAVLTIVADFPKGMLQPNLKNQIELFLSQFPLEDWLYVGLVFPAVTIIVMSFMLIKRRSAQINFLSSILREPPSADQPAVAGVLVDGTVGAREITATLIDLARRKYIFIINKGENNFSFGRRKTGDFETMPDLTSFEKALLSKIFLPPAFKSSIQDVEMRVGRHIFSRKIAQFYLGVYNQATREGYFSQNPAKVHLIYKYIGVVLFFFSFAGFLLTAWLSNGSKFSLIAWLGGMVAAFTIMKFSPFMPARSAKGTAELKKWLGFRRYLTSGKISAAKEVLQGKFEEYLPYAVVLGAEIEWANRFFEEPFVKPDWYESAERAVTLESFIGQFFPFIGYVADNLAKSHEPTVE